MILGVAKFLKMLYNTENQKADESATAPAAPGYKVRGGTNKMIKGTRVCAFVGSGIDYPGEEILEERLRNHFGFQNVRSFSSPQKAYEFFTNQGESTLVLSHVVCVLNESWIPEIGTVFAYTTFAEKVLVPFSRRIEFQHDFGEHDDLLYLEDLLKPETQRLWFEIFGRPDKRVIDPELLVFLENQRGHSHR